MAYITIFLHWFKLGHIFKLQVHDIAGLMQDKTGISLAAPEYYSFLCCK